MFTNVLIGVDGRDGGRDAIALGQLLAAPDAKLTLAHVCTPLLGRGAAEAIGIERAQAKSLLERERDLAVLDAALAIGTARAVGPGLHELAENRGAELLIVGATRRNRLGRVTTGDDSRATLDGAPCALAIAPLGYSLAPHQLRRIGVGYNASPDSVRALSLARELATRGDGELTPLWVISPEEVREEKPIPADWPTATDDLIDRHTQQLARLRGVRGIVACGGPREALVEVGNDLDLLIAGSGGHGRIDRVLHGTVSRYLARHATCPLLVLPGSTVPGGQANRCEREPHRVAIAG